MIKKFLSIVLALIVVLILSGCRSAQMNDLEKLASVIQPHSGREVSRTLHDKGIVLETPDYAEIYLEFEPVDDHSKKEVFDEIITILESNNWVGGDMGLVPDFFKGSLKRGNSRFIVNVSIASEKNIVSVQLINRE